MARKHIEIVIFLFVFLLGVYLLFMPTLQYVYGLKRASYHQDVVSQFADVEQLEVVRYTNNTNSLLVLLSLMDQEGLLAVDHNGARQFLIKSFPEYAIYIKTIYYDNNKDELWILPNLYYAAPYSYSVPWIYILNVSTGDIIRKIPTNNSYRGHAFCMYNDTGYVAFDNSGLRASFGFVKDYTLTTSVNLDYYIGMVEGHLCLNDSMITLHHNTIIRYYYNDTQNLEFLVKKNKNTMYSITWDGKNTVYYTEDIKNNSPIVSNIISLNLVTNETNIINMPFNVHDIMFDDGLIYIAGNDFNLYIYNISTNTYYRKLDSIGEYPSIHKLNDNFMVIGNYLLNKKENMLFRINVSECCWDATMTN